MRSRLIASLTMLSAPMVVLSPSAYSAGLLDAKGALAEVVRQTDQIKAVIAVENNAIRSLQSQNMPVLVMPVPVPLPASRGQPAEAVPNPASVPLPGSNGHPSGASSNPAPGVAHDNVSPQSLRNTVARQTDQQREAVSTDIQQQITELQTQLIRRLAIRPQTQALALEIGALNDALSAKRQAYEFAKGNSNAISPAAAESYAAIANPYFLMCGDKFWAPKDPIKWLEKISARADKITTVGRSVGLLTVEGRPAGTGVVVGPRHILTNLHVLKQLADYDDATKTWMIRASAKITFDKEYPLGRDARCETPNPPREYFLNAVDTVPANSDDLAIIMTSIDARFPHQLTFSARANSAYAGNMIVALVGYPGPPADMTVAEQIEFFHTPLTKTPQFPYKRLSEGFTGNEQVSDDGYFVHKANTAGGNSGSPVIDLDDGAVVGLHVEGVDRFQDALGYNRALVSERVNALLIRAGLVQ